MAEALRYVVLYHDGVAEPHYDLMFEDPAGGDLRTWRSPAWPIGTHTPLEKLADHRREYLDYEGPVSGDRGFVRRVESGTYKSWPQFLEDEVFDLWLDGPTKTHLWLLAPPQHA